MTVAGADSIAEAPYAKLAHGVLPAADGFRGIWYANQPSGDEYKFKYSGGLATYPQQHHPIAIYAKAVDKTFFVYGGRYADRNRLLHMVSYYDHQTRQVARPRVLLDKQTDDAHDNPTLAMDDKGHLFIFSNSHGTGRPSYIHRSRKPYDITSFELLKKTNFSYGQPWHIPGEGLVLLHTLYKGGRQLHATRSRDGREWSKPTLLAKVAQGHYQVSWRHGKKIGTAFNYHPANKGLNWRTNLYYMQTDDAGRTWLNVKGEKLDLPLAESDNKALAVEYESKQRLVYMKDIQFTADGRPVILYMTSRGYRSGPQNNPRWFTTARWTGSEWDVQQITQGDNNYDFGSLYIESANQWRIIGTTEPGPQAFNTGGEMAIWLSNDQGQRWRKVKQLTHGSRFNHTYPRRPLNAHRDFYALWADGHGRERSVSRLYFTDREGSGVWQLPTEMSGPFAKPAIVNR